MQEAVAGEVDLDLFSPSANFFACDCGIPAAFGTKNAHIVFGENGRYVTEEQLADGAVLDIAAALILMERGIDVGIEAMGEAQTLSGLEKFPEQNERVIVGKMKRHRDVQLKPGAEVLSMIEEHTTAYRYENAEGIRFHGVVDLIRKLENMLDQMQFPQSFSLVRRFSDVRTASAAGGSTEMKPHNGDVATFAVRVLFRQNASWQGSILWVEGDREESFRSVLELIFLLDSAAGAEENVR